MVIDLQRGAEFAVLVLQRVEAVRAGGHDLLHTVPLKDGHVLGSLLLEQELLADAARGIAGAGLLAAEAGEPDAGLLEQRGGRPRRLRIAPGSVAPAQPTQNRYSKSDAVAAKRDVQALHPVLAAGGGLPQALPVLAVCRSIVAPRSRPVGPR